MLIKWVVVERQNMSGRYVALRGLSFESKEAAEAHIVENYREAFPQEVSRREPRDQAGRGSEPDALPVLRSVHPRQPRHDCPHGYERPGHGWQTGSCMGAKNLPFEVDRDRARAT